MVKENTKTVPKKHQERHLWVKNRTTKNNQPIMTLRIGQAVNKFNETIILTLKANLIKTSNQDKPRRSLYIEAMPERNSTFAKTFRKTVSAADLKEFLEYLELFAPITPKWHIDPKTKWPVDSPSNVHIFNPKLWEFYTGEVPKPQTRGRLRYLRSKDNEKT